MSGTIGLLRVYAKLLSNIRSVLRDVMEPMTVSLGRCVCGV
jgi:hypothetical protein